ncbi:hypothetical protein Z043_104762 [Scleropages formosus]|uniref:Uncharacterized protein n=1 Tax=Scleropages formosus TaxID=113540 RepID=A0A0N8K1U8_SCLFO|nr:hypothetical protein Z043_104762 [Scleropages formosus]
MREPAAQQQLGDTPWKPNRRKKAVIAGPRRALPLRDPPRPRVPRKSDTQSHGTLPRAESAQDASGGPGSEEQVRERGVLQEAESGVRGTARAHTLPVEDTKGVPYDTFTTLMTLFITLKRDTCRDHPGTLDSITVYVDRCVPCLSSVFSISKQIITVNMLNISSPLRSSE